MSIFNFLKKNKKEKSIQAATMQIKKSKKNKYLTMKSTRRKKLAKIKWGAW